MSLNGIGIEERLAKVMKERGEEFNARFQEALQASGVKVEPITPSILWMLANDTPKNLAAFEEVWEKHHQQLIQDMSTLRRDYQMQDEEKKMDPEENKVPEQALQRLRIG
jgi:hypothetical protein